MTEGDSERAPQPGDDPSAEDAWLDRSPEDTEAERARRRERREEHKRRVRRRRRRKRVLAGTAAGLATLLVLGVLWFWWTFGGLERMPDAVGRAGADTPGTTILLVGSDAAKSPAPRGSRSGWQQDLLQSDLVMLLHLTADKRSMYVISIPRDSIVDIPSVGPGKLADAARAGGSALFVRSVEQLTGVRMDRLAVLDLNAFRETADLLGGVVVQVPPSACDLRAGRHRFDGQAALDLIALQPCMTRQDLDRVRRQQSLMKALMRSAVDGGRIANPLTVNRLLRATSRHLALEDGFSYPSMLGTMWSMRHLRTSNTTFLTVPVMARPLATRDGVDYVLLDAEAGSRLWAALRADRLAEYLALSTDAEVLADG